MDSTDSHNIKLLFVIESLQCGGAEKSLTTLLQNLDYQRYEVSLLIMQKGGEFEKFIPEQVQLIYKNVYKGVSKLTNLVNRFRFLLLRKTNGSRKFHAAQLYWKAFGRQIQKHTASYDIAIAYNQGFSTYYVADKVTASKKIAWLNTDYNKAGYKINFDITFYTTYNKVVCVSKENENSLLDAAKTLKTTLPTTVIKDITDHQLVRKMSTNEEGFVNQDHKTTILTVGRLTKAKGLDMAIDACELLKEKGHSVKWYVIGDGPDRQQLQERIDSKNLQQDFELLGFRENPYPYMRTCDIYAQTSLFEGLGLTVIEASILQKPIVTTNFPTAASIITHQRTGLICEMNKTEIANSIIRYIEDDDFTNLVSENLKTISNEDKEISLLQINKILTE